MPKLFFAIVALCAIQSTIAFVSHEEVLEAQRQIEVKIYVTKHIETYTKRILEERFREFRIISLRVWNALNRDIEGHIDRQDCIKDANSTLLDLQANVIETSKQHCKYDLVNEFGKIHLVLLDSFLDLMKSAEISCDQLGVDYHKCLRTLIDTSKKGSDEVLKNVNEAPGEISSSIDTCLIDLYVNQIVARTDKARMDMFACLEKE